MLPSFIDRCSKCLFISLIIYSIFILGLIFRFYLLSNPKHITNMQTPCKFINSVSSEQHWMLIKFNKDITRSNPLNLSSYFGYFTSVHDSPLLMPPGSVYQTSIHKNTLNFSFSIPFISNYSGILFCIDQEIYQAPPFQLPIFNETGILFKQNINLSVPYFRSELDDTQFYCHGNKPEERWCQVRHIGLANSKFVMQTSAHFLFPFSFLSLGGRSAPFDSIKGRINNEPLLTTRNLAELSVGGAPNDEIAIMASHCLNPNNTFDVIFDFLIPAYRTIQKVKNDSTFYSNHNFRFFFRNNVNTENLQLIQAITGDPPASPPTTNHLLLFERLILGLEKADEVCDSTRSLFYQHGHIYKYNRENTLGFRETILNNLNIPINSNEIINPPHHETNKIDLNNNEINQNDLNNDEINQIDLHNDEINRIDLNNELVDVDDDFYDNDVENNSKNRLIVSIFDAPGNEKLRIFNIEPLKRLISRSCSFCTINSIDVDSHNLTSLIEMASKSKVFIARSGVGFEHVIWLSPDSYVVELKPYGFWCEDKYEIAAKISGSKYYSVMNDDVNIQNKLKQYRKRLNTCLSAKSYCESPECYDVLFEQLIDVDLAIFNQTWTSILADLQVKYPVHEK